MKAFFYSRFDLDNHFMFDIKTFWLEERTGLEEGFKQRQGPKNREKLACGMWHVA
jgi:hypothetical protein